MSYLDTIRTQLDEKIATAEEFLQRDGFDPADPAYVELTGEIDTLKRSYDRAVDIHNTRQAAVKLGDSIMRGESRQRAADSAPVEAEASMGELFTRSEVFQTYPGRGTSSRLEINERALPMGIGSVSDGIPAPQRITLGSVEGPAPLLGLIPSVQVSSNAVEVITWSKVAGGADKVAEGAPKPSAEWAPTNVPVTLDTIAVYTQMTRQMIEDAPAVRSTIDQELRAEVLRKLEAEAAGAIGGATLPTAQGEDLLKAIRAGIGVVQAEGFTPNVVLLNPADWASLDVSVLGQTLLGPSVQSQYWGLRPVASVAQPAGTAVVGDFSAGAARYTRTGVSLYITDSHADTFTKNVFTILAEARASTVVTRAAAFAECSAAA